MTETETKSRKGGRKSAEEKASLPPLDFDSLAVEDAEVPAITRQRDEKPNPFVAPLLETYAARKAGNEKAGKSVTVPAERAGEVKYLIRQAATRNNIGARIAEEVSEDGKHVRIIFAGKDKRASKSGETAATQDAPTE
jgi:hypothetical protein